MNNFYKGGSELPIDKDDSSSIQTKTNRLTALQNTVVNIPFIQIIILTILFTLVSMFSLSAQTPRKDSGADGLLETKRLYINDKIPDELWDLELPVVNHPTGKEHIRLQEYKSKKLILIDCWATTCKSCLEGLPKIQQLQSEYNDVTFLLSTLQSDRAADYLKNNNYPCISLINTRETLFRYFPYAWIPYYIWISDGKVVATTQASEVTAQNIDRLLHEGIPPSRVRQDRVSFQLQDKFLNDPLISRIPELRRSFTITGYLQDIMGQTNYTIGSNDEPSFFATTNAAPLELFKSVIAIVRPDLRKGTKFLIETKWRDSLLAINREGNEHHLFSIQYYSSARDKQTLSTQLLDELNTFFVQQYGFEGRIQRRMRQAYVLREDKTVLTTKLSKKLTGELPLYQLIDRLDELNEQNNTNIPWVNETTEFKKLIKVPDDLPNNLDAINAFLGPQGYKASLASVAMEVFVISDVKKGVDHE